MFFLIACILCSSFLYIIFKGFEKYKVDLLQAIVINYVVAGSLGFLLARFYGLDQSVSYILNANWLMHAFVIGFMFITIFNLMGISSQRSGISITSVANKMSVVLPVVFGFIFLHEMVTIPKIVGIGLAVVALFFTTYTSDKVNTRTLIFPIIIFFASGILDIIMSYCSRVFLLPQDSLVFTATLFSVAALFGMFFLLFLVLAGKQKIRSKNILAGVILGIPNFGSILFVFEGLKSTGWDVSVFYPVLNMGTVVMASFFGWLIYKEKLSLINFIGICLASLAIYLISL